MTMICVQRFRGAFLNRILMPCTSFEEKGRGWTRRGWSTSNMPSQMENETDIYEGMVVSRSNSVGERTLRSVLGVEHTHAKLIVKKFPGFNTARGESLSTTLKYLTDNGIPLDRILRNPWLLLITPDILEKRLKSVTDIFPTRSIQFALPFIRLNVSKLLEISSLWKLDGNRETSLVQGNFPSRVEYLAAHLKCSENEVADLMVRVKRLPTTPFWKIETVLHLLLEGGVNPTDIKEDPWIFVHNISVMKERMDDAQRRRLSTIKPWMLRCSLTKYESYIERALKEQNLKPTSEKLDSFLQRRLNWSASCANNVLSREPLIRESKASRLESMISFLLAKGFSPDDIARNPRILRQSVATVATKLSELAELTQCAGHPTNSLSILCRGNKKYLKYIDDCKARSVPQIPEVSQQITDTTGSVQSDTQVH